jgi:twitching motility two-component system response regulator PilG
MDDTNVNQPNPASGTQPDANLAPSNASNVHAVSLLGFVNQTEQAIIRRFFDMSRSSARPFGYTDSSGTSSGPKVFILDVDNADAVKAWHNLGGSSLPTLQIGFKPIDPALRWVPRPFSLRAIKELDHLVETLRNSEPAHAAIAAPVNPQPQPSIPRIIAPQVATQPTSPTPIGADAPKVVALPVQMKPRAAAQVLVVDDSPVVRSLMELKLSAYGIVVDYAEDGLSALKALKAGSHQLVFMDVVMPGMDGYETCKRIKQDPSLRHVEVVMLTSRDGMFDKMRGSMAGCNAYLVKPVDEGKLFGLLDKLFKPVR